MESIEQTEAIAAILLELSMGDRASPCLTSLHPNNKGTRNRGQRSSTGHWVCDRYYPESSEIKVGPDHIVTQVWTEKHGLVVGGIQTDHRSLHVKQKTQALRD